MQVLQPGGRKHPFPRPFWRMEMIAAAVAWKDPRATVGGLPAFVQDRHGGGDQGHHDNRSVLCLGNPPISRLQVQVRPLHREDVSLPGTRQQRIRKKSRKTSGSAWMAAKNFSASCCCKKRSLATSGNFFTPRQGLSPR